MSLFFFFWLLHDIYFTGLEETNNTISYTTPDTHSHKRKRKTYVASICLIFGKNNLILFR